MGYTKAYEDVTKYIDDNYSMTEISYPNTDNFEPPNPPEEFVKFNMVDGDSEKLEVGRWGLNRYAGVLYFRVNVPIGHGDRSWRKIADRLRELFEFQSVGSIKTREIEIGSKERDEDNSWLEVPVMFGFRFQEQAP